IDFILRQIREVGHAPAPFLNDRRNPRPIQPCTDVHQRRKVWRRAFSVVVMANAALALINRLAAQLLCCVRRELRIPWDVIRIHVQNAGLWVERRTTPLRAPIKSRKDDRWLLGTEWNKLPRAVESAELLQRPLVCLGRTRREHVLSQQLTRIRLRLYRQALFRCGHFAGQVALRIFLVLDWEQWLAI